MRPRGPGALAQAIRSSQWRALDFFVCCSKAVKAVTDDEHASAAPEEQGCGLELFACGACKFTLCATRRSEYGGCCEGFGVFEAEQLPHALTETFTLEQGWKGAVARVLFIQCAEQPDSFVTDVDDAKEANMGGVSR